jgi:hypothetical protein
LELGIGRPSRHPSFTSVPNTATLPS